MIANPALIQFSAEPLAALFAFVKVGLGLGLISYATIAPLRFILRVLFPGIGVVCLLPFGV